MLPPAYAIKVSRVKPTAISWSPHHSSN